MLKQRIITAVVLVAALLAALFAVNPIYWQLFIGVALFGGFYEWLRFCGISHIVEKIAACVGFVVVSYALHAGYLEFGLVVPVICVLWLALLAFTFLDVLSFFHLKWVKLVIGLITLASAGWLIVEFKKMENGPIWVIYFFLCVIAADVGAYFVGKRFGKTKLAPSISPGKTVEGFLGGLALVALIFVPLAFSQFSTGVAFAFLLTAMLTAVVSVGGDLFESKLKRYAGLKDSSQILPGHGGILDRVDSLMAGIPVFALGLLLLGFLR